jgi:hypothetical protein
MKKFGLVFALLVVCSPWLHAQNADSFWNLGPGQCSGSPSANAVAPTGAAGIGTGWTTQGTSFLPVFQVSSSAAATDTITCAIDCASRTTAGKGCTIFGFNFNYGILTTAATSESAPVCGQITSIPPPSAAETPSTVAPVGITVTAVPVIGSANLGTTTAGALLSQYVAFPAGGVSLNGPYQKIVCTFAFGQTAAAAMVVYTPGGTIFGVNNYQ